MGVVDVEEDVVVVVEVEVDFAAGVEGVEADFLGAMVAVVVGERVSWGVSSGEVD